MVLDTDATIRAAVVEGAGPAVLSMVFVRDGIAEGRFVGVLIAGVDLSRRVRAVRRTFRLTGPSENPLRIAV